MGEAMEIIVVALVPAIIAYTIGWLRGFDAGEAHERKSAWGRTVARFERDANRIGHTILMQTTRSIAQENFARPMSIAEVTSGSAFTLETFDD